MRFFLNFFAVDFTLKTPNILILFTTFAFIFMVKT